MYSMKDLDAEISAKVEWLYTNNGRVLQKSWLIQAILADHSQVEGDDADVALCLMRYTVSARVLSFFNKQKGAVPSSTQMILPGFKHLQKAYAVEREDDTVFVPIDEMTDEEILAKANEHAAQGKGHYEHRDELMRYLQARTATSSGQHSIS